MAIAPTRFPRVDPRERGRGQIRETEALRLRAVAWIRRSSPEMIERVFAAAEEDDDDGDGDGDGDDDED